MFFTPTTDVYSFNIRKQKPEGALLKNIRLGWKSLSGTNTLAFSVTKKKYMDQ